MTHQCQSDIAESSTHDKRERWFVRPVMVLAVVAPTLVAACAHRQSPATSLAVIARGGFSVVMPRDVCSDTDSVGTQFVGAIYRYDMRTSTFDRAIPDKSTAQVTVRSFRHPIFSIEFRVDAITIRSRRIKIDPPFVGFADIVSLHQPDNPGRRGVVCYSTGAVFEASLNDSLVVPRVQKP